MAKTDTIEKYEVVVIVDANLGGDEKDALMKEVSGYIEKNGGKVVNSSVWLEKQKFTFPMKKLNEGTYILVNYEADGTVNAKLEAALRLNEKILRYAVIKSE